MSIKKKSSQLKTKNTIIYEKKDIYFFYCF